MPRKQIIATIDKNGEVEFEAEGFEGGECSKVIDEIANKMGATTKTTKKKSRWHSKNKVNVEQDY